MKKILGLITVVLLSPVFSPTAFAFLTQEGLQSSQMPFTNLGLFISNVAAVGFIVAGLAAFAYLVLGGFQYITSGGDKMAAQGARDRITYAILGLAIVAAAAAIISVAQAVFGITILGTIKWPGAERTIGTP